MAISTYKTFLMKGTAGSGSTVTYAKLCDIKSFPNLGAAPEMLETTTLSNKAQTFIPGIQTTEAMEFTCNYDSATFDTLAALAGQDNHYAVWFGGTESGGVATPDGSAGQFSFKGDLRVYVNGAGVNAVTEMTVVIAPSTEITKESGT